MKPGDRVKHRNLDKNILGNYIGQATLYSNTSINVDAVIDIVRGTKGKLEIVEKLRKYQDLNKMIPVSILDLDDRSGYTVIDTEDFLAKYVKIEQYQADLFAGLSTEEK